MTATGHAAAGLAPHRAKKRRPPAPTQDALIDQLRADLIAERAVSLRLCGFIDEVLGVELPDDRAIHGWEAEGYWEYWREQAECSLRDDDMERRDCGPDDPIPVMGPEPVAVDETTEEARCSRTSPAAA